MNKLIQPSPELQCVLYTKAMIRDRLNDKQAYRYTGVEHCRYVRKWGRDNTLYESITGLMFEEN